MAAHWGWIDRIADFELGEVQVCHCVVLTYIFSMIRHCWSSYVFHSIVVVCTDCIFSGFHVHAISTFNLPHLPHHFVPRHRHRRTQIAIQNFTIVIEMFITAIAHKYVFGHEAYADGSLKIIMDARAAAWKEQTDPNSYAVRRTASKQKIYKNSAFFHFALNVRIVIV